MARDMRDRAHWLPLHLAQGMVDEWRVGHCNRTVLSLTNLPPLDGRFRFFGLKT